MFRKMDYNKNYYAKHRQNLLVQKKLYYKTEKGKLVRQKASKKQAQICRKLLRELKINGCAICGYNKCTLALQFHHVNPKDKKFNIIMKQMYNKEIISELNKCILLCANCHLEIHAM